MRKGTTYIPKQYIQNTCMAQKVADGIYIQNVVTAIPLNQEWIAINNVSLK